MHEEGLNVRMIDSFECPGFTKDEDRVSKELEGVKTPVIMVVDAIFHKIHIRCPHLRIKEDRLSREFRIGFCEKKRSEEKTRCPYYSYR